MTDKNDTPAESPLAKRSAMDTRLSGTDFDEMNGENPRLSRDLPELPRLTTGVSLEQQIREVAYRDGTLASFFYKQWPILVDKVTSFETRFEDALKQVEARNRSSFVWPLLTGLSIAVAFAAWIPKLLGK